MKKDELAYKIRMKSSLIPFIMLMEYKKIELLVMYNKLYKDECN